MTPGLWTRGDGRRAYVVGEAIATRRIEAGETIVLYDDCSGPLWAHPAKTWTGAPRQPLALPTESKGDADADDR